jgi:hypothetical protein
MPHSKIGRPRPNTELSGHDKLEPETGPVAIEVNAFCEQYALGRSKAYGLIADGSVAAKKMGRKTLIDVRSARNWYNNLPSLQSKAKL